MSSSHNTWRALLDNPSAREKFVKRAEIISAIRSFFATEQFLEVETPLLVPSPGTEPYLEVFETELQVADGRTKRAFLLTSPELAMKKLLVAGFPRIFQLCKSFRNGEGVSFTHNHEFTILEWYRTHANYFDIMQDCEQLLLHIFNTLHPDASEPVLKYQGKRFSMATPWERITVAEAFQRFAGVPEAALHDRSNMCAVAAEKGYQTSAETTWEEAYNQVFLNEVEPKLGVTAPTFLYEYPAAQAALSRKKVSDSRYAERFELYLGGLELGNAFSELTDANEQESRMHTDLAERAALGKTKYEIDTEFIAALQQGMPESGGIAMGVDRIIMLFLDTTNISDVVLFPVAEIFEL